MKLGAKMASTNGPDHDYPIYDPRKLKAMYMVCSAPRTGSTLLCRLLQQTLKMGFPSEYFNQSNHVKEWQARFAFNDIDELVDLLKQRRTSPNGVFGFKAHLDQFNFLRKSLDFEESFPRLKFILIQRRDLLLQAISLSRAQQTNAWSTLRTPTKSARFDLKHIEECCDVIQSQVSGWKKLFAFFGLEYVEVYYEDLCSSPQEIIDDCMRFVGVEPVPVSMDEVDIGVQRDEQTDLWIQNIRQQVKI